MNNKCQQDFLDLNFCHVQKRHNSNFHSSNISMGQSSFYERCINIASYVQQVEGYGVAHQRGRVKSCLLHIA